MPLWIRTTDRSASRRTASSVRSATASIGATLIRPRELRPIPEHDARRREPGDAHAHSLTAYDAIGREEQRITGKIEDVRAHIGKADIPDRATEEWHSPIEIVVPRRRRVIAREIHRFDDGVRLAMRHPGEIGREGIALQEIAGIEQDHLSRISRAQRVHHSRDARDAIRGRTIFDVVAPGDVPVEIGGGNQHHVGSVLNRRDEERCRDEQGNHRRAIYSRP